MSARKLTGVISYVCEKAILEYLRRYYNNTFETNISHQKYFPQFYNL